MIEFKEVTKSFGGQKALDGLDLHVPQGTVYGLVGENGAGKSTAIRLMTGAVRPDRGEVRVLGEPVFENRAVKSRMAMIPDEIFYFNTANLRDMAQFYAGVYPSFDRALYGRVAEGFALPEKKLLRDYSRGMVKQAAFLLAISIRPDVLLLDEPVDGLDPVMRRQVWSLVLQEVAERGVTVLVSSHNLRELEDVCDHVGILHRGKMLLERSLSELEGGVSKVQAVLPEGAVLPTGLDLLHRSAQGKLETLIVRGPREHTENLLATVHPLYCEIVPLTLEEIFLYELGGVDYDVKSILL